MNQTLSVRFASGTGDVPAKSPRAATAERGHGGASFDTTMTFARNRDLPASCLWEPAVRLRISRSLEQRQQRA